MKGMLKVSAPAISISVLAFLAFAQANDPSGCWTATLRKGDRTGTATLNMNVSGNQVTGTISDPSGQTLQIENGKIEGNQLTFDVTARDLGRMKNTHFFGQVANDLITLDNESRGKRGQRMTFHRIRD